MADHRIRATLSGHALWAFQKYKRISGKKTDSVVLEVMIDRWLSADREFAEEHGLTLADYNREEGIANVVAFDGDQREVSS